MALDAGLMRIQVSELAKVALVVVLAHYASVYQHHLREFRQGFLYPISMVALCTGLILLEPDFGTAFLCAAVGFILLFLVGVRLQYWVPCVLSGFLLFMLAVWLSPVRLRRITAFLDVQANKQDSAYQLWQGILAFGSGGVRGVGLGQGRQQWSFLPEAHTDFIFPIVGEELGVCFTLGVATLFILIFVCGVLAVRWACDMYSFVLAMGALLFVTLQAFINMAVVMGLVPTKGMSLPFISYGGSNLLVMCVFLGLFLNCCKTWEHLPLQAREL
jgi:cell division protein FtsW